MNSAFKRLFLIAVSLGVVGSCAAALHSLSRQRAERMNFEISEMASVVSVQVRGELEHLLRRVTELGEKPIDGAKLSEADYEIVSLSAWEKGGGDGQTLVRTATLTHPENTAVAATPVNDEESDRKIAAKALKGRPVLDYQGLQGAKLGVIVVPMGTLPIKRVALARFRLDRFQSAFRTNDTSMELSLLGSNGMIFADKNPDHIGTASPVAGQVFASRGGMRSGEFDYKDSSGVEKRYSYRLVSQGQFAVLSALPSSEGKLSTRELLVFFGLIAFFLVGVTAANLLGLFKGRKSAPTSESDRSKELPKELAEPVADLPPPFVPAADRKLISVLYVSMLPRDPALENASLEDIVSIMNEFFEIGSTQIGRFEGVLERGAGASFLGSWDDPAKAMRCALNLRQEFFNYTQSQKLEGKPAVTVIMGADWGMGLVANVGPAGNRSRTTVGDVSVNARALALLSPSVETDLLVSQAFWEQVAPGFVGSRAAEANLTSLSGLTACYRIKGYHDEDGKSVLTPMPSISPAVIGLDPKLQEVVPDSVRWLVNNGTQIVGPFSASEIASQLYAMELDFDCECWREGAGDRRSIAKAGLFGELSEDTAAELWVYDGKTIHGPVTEGFLKTALQHGAVQESDLVCQSSTISGWRKVSEVLTPKTPTVVLQDPPTAA
ncbi:MAG: hypothetical protein P4M08_11045 [Oligoflexia bacterium]|nr:hypothetical protein [Oligoflexia bacterium]